MTDTEAGQLGAVRSSIATAADAKPARGNDTNVDLNKGRSEPVSVLRGWTSTKRADTVGSNVEDAAMTVVTRGVDSLPTVIGARLTTVTESAVNLVPAAAVLKTAAPAAELRELAPPNALSRLLAVVGLVPLAGTGPADPGPIAGHVGAVGIRSP